MAGLVHGYSRLTAILSVLVAGAAALPAQLPKPVPETQLPAEEIPYVLHIHTREVVLDVIAVDGHDRLVTDLVPGDIQVHEKLGGSSEIAESVSSFRLIDPTGSHASVSGDLPSTGFGIAANESCLQRQSIHYQLVYNPGQQALVPGSHEVHIATTRRGVRLFYRHSYAIGATAPVQAAVSQTKAQIGRDLELDACSHPLTPLSISLRAVRISTGSKFTARFRLSIDNDSLAFVSFSNEGRGLQLDYGACNFNVAGKPIGYMTASSDRVMTPVEFARAEAYGLQQILEFPLPVDLAMTRFVVRDRATGNLGLVDVVFPPGSDNATSSSPSTPDQARHDPRMLKALGTQQRADFEHFSGYHSNSASPLESTNAFRPDPNAEPILGPVGSFGSVVPDVHAFCGDVFELKAGIRTLPDFRVLDSIGSIYTTFLGVPYQNLPPGTGIPGVTDRIEWFGVDYHAAFWINDPGRYEFTIMSDDGAALLVDDKRIIDIDGLHNPRKHTGAIQLQTGRHAIHVPYFEGTPTGVALGLWVRKPGEEKWKIFDLRDFAEPCRKTQ